MNINDAFPSKYLKSGDINDEDLVLTISTVEMETIGEDQKPVVYFDETEKGLVLNKTNSGTIATMYGFDTDDWAGKKIALFATEVDFQGKQTLALRVRMRQPKVAKMGNKPASGAVTAYWTFVRENSLETKMATDLVAENNGDFAAALAALKGE